MTLYDRLDDIPRIRYPFAEDSGMRYVAGGGAELVLPDAVFLDASVSSYDGTTAQCYLSAVKLEGGGLHARFNVCGIETELVVPVSGLLSEMQFQASGATSGGFLFGNEGLSALPMQMTQNTWYTRADANTGVFEPRCVVYSPGGAVLSITGNAPGSSTVTGDIAVVDGINTRVRVSAATNTVVIFTEPGIGLKNCLQQVFEEGSDAVYVFNGAEPDSAGNVTLATDGHLKLETVGDELHLKLAEDIVALVDCTPLYEGVAE